MSEVNMSEINKQTHHFQAEVGKVLDLVINSLYSNKEIFLRELISNASDANDKLRFAALNDKALYGDDFDLKIRISVDKKARTIQITDNGIGMTRQDVVDHLGTIAKSGTHEFLTQLSGDQQKDSHLIGQFGVGFYSAFIVADKVTVHTRKAGAPANEGVRWESNGSGEYTVETVEKNTRGTEITLRLRQDLDEFLEEVRLQHIITKYSDHIAWPILMLTETEKDGETVLEEKTVNRATALWTMPKNKITDEEYREFYKHVAHDFEEPLLWMHNHVEGKNNYTTLLYIPKHAPFDLWYPQFQHGLKLYVQRVFIMDNAEHFLPRYLRFVKGLVDCADLPLNVSREILQDNKLIDVIRTASIKKVLSTLETLAKDEPEKFDEFWQQFGQVLKEGIIEDPAHREQISKLMRFASTHDESGKQSVSLADYISRMKPEQDKIYYLTAENYTAAKYSPHLEIFREKGIEVLLLSDRIDDWLVMHLSEFEGKQLQSVAKGDLDLSKLGDEQAEVDKPKEADDWNTVLEYAKKALENKAKDVRITHRLTHSPACVVADDNDIGFQMQRVLKAVGQDMPATKPILELNPNHPIVLHLKREHDDNRFAEWVHILFDQAVLAEGGQPEQPAIFVERLNRVFQSLITK